MLNIQQMSKSFKGDKGQDAKPILKSINLQLAPGEFCLVIGSNGSGKSTLLKTISGEYLPDAGEIKINQQIVTAANRHHLVTSVIQDVHQGTISQLTLLENMVLSLSRTKKINFRLYRRLKHLVSAELKRAGMGLVEYLHTPLGHLSGGQRQMVATIMAMLSSPKVLLLDEHTSALDPSMQKIVMQYTHQAIREKRLTTLMVTHNLADAVHYGNRLIMLHQGQIVLDVRGEQKSKLSIQTLLELFQQYEARILTEGVA